MTRILLTNDDGIHSDGLVTLERALREVGDVYVVAPAAEMSGASHSLTLARPLRIRQVDSRHWTVDGTPTDCVTLALHKILEEHELPHVCVSGINHGGNLGDDATYSGTVAGALEATILGVPGLAVWKGDRVAACVAGALSLEDAALVVALRHQPEEVHRQLVVPVRGRPGGGPDHQRMAEPQPLLVDLDRFKPVNDRLKATAAMQEHELLEQMHVLLIFQQRAIQRRDRLRGVAGAGSHQRHRSRTPSVSASNDASTPPTMAPE